MSAVRTDHVGSLLRPDKLLKARDNYAQGRFLIEQLRVIEDEAIADVIAMQREIGLVYATDGEFRRSSFLAGPY